MYAVIFRAEIKSLDQEYFETAKRMRELALNKYGCSEFVSTTEGDHEISISYWKSQEQIKSWKEDREHLKAQDLGKNKWYKSYRVQIVEVIREYNENRRKSLSNTTYQWEYKKIDLKYCPRCGAPFSLEDVHIPDQPQLVCHTCKFVFYLSPKLVVIAVIVYEGQVLLLRRAEEPGKGRWALLAGYVERGEGPIDALKREVKEETGLEIEVGRIRAVNSYSAAEMVQLVYAATATNDQIRINTESVEGRFFAYNEIPWSEMAFESTKRIIDSILFVA